MEHLDNGVAVDALGTASLGVGPSSTVHGAHLDAVPALHFFRNRTIRRCKMLAVSAPRCVKLNKRGGNATRKNHAEATFALTRVPTLGADPQGWAWLRKSMAQQPIARHALFCVIVVVLPP